MKRVEIFLTSDQHWGHNNIISYDNRPFENIDHMNEELILRWNNVVNYEDIVIHLGDVSFLNPQKTIDIVKKLNGKIILINGNHDHRTRKFWEEKAGIRKWYKNPVRIQNIWLTHALRWDIGEIKNIKVNKKMYKEIKFNDVVIHGHRHDDIIFTDFNCINVSVTAWNYTPVNIDFLKDICYNNNFNREFKIIKEWVMQYE